MHHRRQHSPQHSPQHSRTTRLATCAIAFVATLGMWASAGPAQAGSPAAAKPPVQAAAITQPTQPTSGPGGSDYAHKSFTVTAVGEGDNAAFVFQPASPKPKTAPLAVVMHGYFEFSGYDSMAALVEHTVRQGNVVIYPRWQTGITSPCPGPYFIEPCIGSAVAGIRNGLAHLAADPTRVQPRLKQTSYFGFSFGGILTANMTNRYASLGLPKPRAIFLEDPHDSGLAGEGEPSLDDSLAGIPADTLVQCHSSENGVIGEPGKALSSCNAVFPLLAHIPAQNKDLVLLHADDHGTPALEAGHGVCTAPSGGGDAYDWNFCWKTFDALRDCAYDNRNCQYALGTHRKHTFMGTWSDGVAITPLAVQDAAPIAA